MTSSDTNGNADPMKRARAAIPFGGEEVALGDASTVLVRLLKPAQLRDYQKALDDEPAMIRLFTGKDSPWVAQLDPDSWHRILEAGEGLNQGPFDQFLQRQHRRLRQVAPEIYERLLQGHPGSSGEPST